MTGPATILIVDDIEANRDVLQGLVLSLGHQAVLAENGLAALKQIRKQTPDIVLLDILMPEMDGFDVLNQIQDDFLLRHIPIIVISAIDDMASIIRCIDMGADDYLTKPFERALLKARLNSCLEKKYLRDLEVHYRQQIEAQNQALEKRIQEKTQALAEANEKLRIINQAKGDLLKLIAYELRKPVKDVWGAVKTVFKKEGLSRTLDLVKHSFLFSQISASDEKFSLDVETIHMALTSAAQMVSDLAKLHQVSIGSVPTCDKPGPSHKELQGQLWNSLYTLEQSSEFGYDIDWPQPYVPDSGANSIEKKATYPKEVLLAKAFVELIKTAILLTTPAHQLELFCDVIEKEVSIRILAQGRTIPEEMVPAFFEVAANHTLVGDYVGASVAKRLIMLFNGSVEVVNQEPPGIIFQVKLILDDPLITLEPSA